jgi:hypothetical protein
VRVVSRLAGIELTTWDGRPQLLGALWRTRPIVLSFVRHFG